MPASLKYNAYHILGLTGTATAKQILQRSNEIIQRLKIDDEIEYEFDITGLKCPRTEEMTLDALRRLQAPKSHLREYFFWFRIADDIDKSAASHLAQKEFAQAATTWGAATDYHIPGAFTHSRNLALALTISLFDAAPLDRLEASLSTWASLLEAPNFWTAFVQEYKQDADALSDETIVEFRSNVTSVLSDLYAEIQEARGGGDFVYRFQQLFSARGKKVEEKILNPILQAVQVSIEQLEQLKFDETKDYGVAKATQLKSPVAGLQADLNKLIDAGLYEDSIAKLLRDRGAKALRNIVLDIHNHHNDLDTSSKLLEFALKIAGTDSLKAMLKDELEQIQKNITHEQDNTIAIEIPGMFGGRTIIFKPDHVIYGKKRINYVDATSMAYHARMQSINFVPISQTYNIMIGSGSQTISISWGTTLYIGNGKKQEVWQKIANITSHVITPTIVDKIARQIFGGETVSIGDIQFTKEGYSRGKMFGSRDEVYWSDVIYEPKFGSGSVTVWKNKDGKGIPFGTVSMSTPNAVVLPELVKLCTKVVADAKR